jgi:two-component system, OmpR family, response regulator
MRVLLVEDDPVLGPELRDALAGAGYAVDLITDGGQAEAVGIDEPYDLAILDLGLPRRNGIDVLQSWRERGKRMPVVVLTARDSWQEKVEGFKAGADDYVGKPFQYEELLARMNAVLRRSQGAAAGEPIRAMGLTLDEATQSIVHEDGTRNTLTGIEFRLLRYFMLHPGQIMSKSRLIEHVYDLDTNRESNVIEVYVNRLRQKIGPGLIVTRRGQGYVFAPAD